MHAPTKEIILASSSPWRKALLERLNLPFRVMAANIDERSAPGESPTDLVARLSQEKAMHIGHKLSGQACVIGSDQVAVVDGTILGKPGSHENAVQQLLSFSDKTVTFLTGLALFDVGYGRCQIDVIPYYVHFRHLDIDRVQAYLEKEKPYQCAGSFKSEGLGIVLFKRMNGDDPTALIGLPLIRLTEMLEQNGVSILDS
jgi:MAF protein